MDRTRVIKKAPARGTSTNQTAQNAAYRAEWVSFGLADALSFGTILESGPHCSCRPNGQSLVRGGHGKIGSCRAGSPRWSTRIPYTRVATPQCLRQGSSWHPSLPCRTLPGPPRDLAGPSADRRPPCTSAARPTRERSSRPFAILEDDVSDEGVAPCGRSTPSREWRLLGDRDRARFVVE